MTPESQSISQSISMLMTQGRSAEARMELERLLALDPEDPEARSLAGDVYAFTGAYAAAYKHYNAAAEIHNRQGRADLALAVHHKILELDPSMLDAATQTRIKLLQLLVFAEDAIVSGQNDKAVSGFSEAIRQFPNHTITYQRLGNLLVRLGRIDEAVANYLTVAEAFFAHELKPKARPYYERILELRPGHGPALDKLCDCLAVEGALGEAPRFIKAAVLAQLQAGDAAAAARDFERLEPGQRDAAGPLAAALLLQRGQREGAERMAQGLDLARPEVADLFKGLARSAADRDDTALAQAYQRWALGQAGVAPAAPKPAGEGGKNASAAMDDDAVALQAMRAAEAMEEPVGPRAQPGRVTDAPPEDRNVLQTMGEMCLAEEMFEEAKQVYERLVLADPEQQAYWDQLNRARAGLGLTPQFPAAKPPRPKGAEAPLAKAPAPMAPAPAPVLVTPPPVVKAPEPVAPPVTPKPTGEGEKAPEPVALPVPAPRAPEPVAKAPEPVVPPAPAPVLKAPEPVAPPATPKQAGEGGKAPDAAPAGKDWIKAPSSIFGRGPLNVPEGRPEIEPMGVHHSTPSKASPGSGSGRPAVEWADSPYAVGPAFAKGSGEAGAEQKPAEPAPVKAPEPAVAPVAPPAAPKPKGEAVKAPEPGAPPPPPAAQRPVSVAQPVMPESPPEPPAHRPVSVALPVMPESPPEPEAPPPPKAPKAQEPVEPAAAKPAPGPRGPAELAPAASGQAPVATPVAPPKAAGPPPLAPVSMAPAPLPPLPGVPKAVPHADAAPAAPSVPLKAAGEGVKAPEPALAQAPAAPPAPPPAAPKADGPKLAPLQPPRIVKVERPMAAAGAPGITRHAFVVQLGELPPAVSSAVDDSDEIIE